MRKISLKYFEFGPVLNEEMWFKDFSYLDLCWPNCLAEQNHLCNFCRRHHQEHYCVIILSLEQWFRRQCRLRYFLSTALVALWFVGVEPFVQFW